MIAIFRSFLLGMALLLGACAGEVPPFVAPKDRPLAQDEKPWPPGRVLTLAYHEINDRDPNQSFMTVRTANLIEQLSWLHEQGFQAISTEQLLAARSGHGKLPAKPLLLSFDDGYSSFYKRVLPLLEAYRWPAILAPVGVWLDTPNGQPVDFGGLAVVRKRFLTREQLREVAKSDLVEIGAHTEALHYGAVANPQFGQLPAAANRLYLMKEKRYESGSEYRQRLHKDVQRITQTLREVTGKTPRVWVWPYGAASGVALQVVEQEGYSMALTLNDGLGSIDMLNNMPRFLLNGDPDTRKFADSISSMRQLGPMRVAHVDLDYVYDPDPRQMDVNLGKLVQRIADLGISSVFLQAYADPLGDGTIKALYFPNRHLPMRADLFNRAAWQLRTRAGVNVFAWMPVLAFDLSNDLPRVQRWDPQSGKLAIDPRQYRRLSPFDARVRQQITEIYEDLASHATFDGLLFHDDALLSDFEDAGPQALAAYRRVGLPDDMRALRGDAQTQWRWSRFKSRYLTEFTLELAARVRAVRGPQVMTARNIYALPILEPKSQAWFAQNFDDFLAAYDWVAPMAMPLMEGVAPKASNAWLERLVKEVAKRPGALERTVFELQARDWQAGREAPIDAQQLAQWMQRLQWSGARHFGYYPDDFINDRPVLKQLRPTFSNAWYPEL